MKPYTKPVFDDTSSKQKSSSSLLDKPVPSDFSQRILPATPFRRGIHALRSIAKKAADKSRKKWNKFYDW